MSTAAASRGAAVAADVATRAHASSWRARSRSRLGGVLDRLALRGMALAFEHTLVPDPDERALVRASAAPYLRSPWDRPPGLFSFLADAVPDLECHRYARRRVDGGAATRYRLASDYVPFDIGAATGGPSANDWIPVEHWRHDQPACATMVALHGFTMGDPDVDAALMMVPDWYRLGLDVALVTLPFHGARTPPTARYSGEPFASWHVGRLTEAVRQSVHDVRRVMRLLRTDGATALGVIGFSLGGYLAALLAGLSDDLAFAIPIAAPVELGVFPSTLFAYSRHAGGQPPPLTRAELATAYRAHSPLARPLAIGRDHVLIVAGHGDAIVPPEQPRALWRHWGGPAIHWYDGSHVAPFRRRDVFAAGVAHLRRVGALCRA